MSSILKALKKLEQDPNRRESAIELWQRKTDPEITSGTGTHSLRNRTIAFYVLLAPFLAIGGWLLLKYALLPTEKSHPGKPIPQSMKAIEINMPSGVAPESEKIELRPKANSLRTSRISDQKERAKTEKTGVAFRTSVRGPEKKGGNLAAVDKRIQAKTQLSPTAKKVRVDSKSLQTVRAPNGASGSPSPEGEPVLNEDKKSYPPPVGTHPSRIIEEPAFDQGSVLTGFTVQAIAWSKIPAERIAVINGIVVREGGFVEGIQVTQIDIDEVSLKKGDKIWLLQCGR